MSVNIYTPIKSAVAFEANPHPVFVIFVSAPTAEPRA